MCVCGWQLIALAVFCQLLIIAYGEYEGRRRAHAALLQARRSHVDCCPDKPSQVAPGPVAGPAAPERRTRHRAGRQPLS